MLKSYLDFEQPIADLEQKILDLKDSDLDEGAIQSEVIRLNESIMKTTEKFILISRLGKMSKLQDILKDLTLKTI